MLGIAPVDFELRSGLVSKGVSGSSSSLPLPCPLRPALTDGKAGGFVSADTHGRNPRCGLVAAATLKIGDGSFGARWALNMELRLGKEESLWDMAGSCWPRELCGSVCPAYALIMLRSVLDSGWWCCGWCWCCCCGEFRGRLVAAPWGLAGPSRTLLGRSWITPLDFFMIFLHAFCAWTSEMPRSSIRIWFSSSGEIPPKASLRFCATRSRAVVILALGGDELGLDAPEPLLICWSALRWVLMPFNSAFSCSIFAWNELGSADRGLDVLGRLPPPPRLPPLERVAALRGGAIPYILDVSK
jgi:hypothetical protein